MEDVTVTYRQLLAPQSVSTAKNPLRVVALCDIDAAYAQFEMVRLGIDRQQPLAVQQWQGLIAVNYPARKFGVSRHEVITEAKKKCPDIMLIHVATYKDGEDEAGYWENPNPASHKVSLDHYRRESIKIIDIFSHSCPRIEKASIDEAFLDFTVPVRDIILERYPYLRESPPEDLETPLPPPPPIDFFQGYALPLEDEESTYDEGLKITTLSNEVSPIPPTWSDIALCIGAELMASCRKKIYQNLGYTCSAGISINKSLAKLCASQKKPDGQSILRRRAVSKYLNPLEFQSIRFLGGKLGTAVAQEYDASTVGDLLNVSAEEFQKTFGEESGVWVWQLIRGTDHSEVTPKVFNKSMNSCKNFRPALKTWDEVVYWIRVLSTELRVRLNESRESNPGTWPKTINLHIRDANLSSSRSHQEPFPFTNNLTTDYIHRFGQKLLLEFLPNEVAAAAQKCDNLNKVDDGKQQQSQQKQKQKQKQNNNSIKLGLIIINMSLGFQGLERVEQGQRGIQGFFKASTPQPDYREAQDSVPQQLSTELKLPSKQPLFQYDSSDGGDDVIVDDSLTSPTYICPKCKQELQPPSSSLEDIDALLESLDSIKREHEDFHFAQDLMDEERKRVKLMHNEAVSNRKAAKPKKSGKKSGSAACSNSSSSKTKPKPSDGQRGIESFFAPKSKSKSL